MLMAGMAYLGRGRYAVSDRKGDEELIRWQRRVLPLMVRMIAGLAIFFFTATAFQLWKLNSSVLSGPTLASANILREQSCPANQTATECLAVRKSDTAALLEADVVAKRYHQGTQLVTASIWSRYLGFITGMTLALIGAAFILGKIESPESNAEGQAGPWRASLKTASPGLALCFFGTVLMIVSMTTQAELHGTDRAVYVGDLPQVDFDATSSSTKK